MLDDKSRLTKLEKQIGELIEAKEKIDRQIEIRDEINKFKASQEKGLFRYIKDIFALLVVLAAMYTGGNKALDSGWVGKLIDGINSGN